MKRDELLPAVLADLHEAYPHIPLTYLDARLLLDALAGRPNRKAST